MDIALYYVFPILSLVVYLLYTALGGSGVIYGAAGVILIGGVFSAVHHAEIVAIRIGEPAGSLVLAVAVTIIEVSLIIAAMASAQGPSAMARDTVFSVVMLACTGVMGLCLFVGGWRHYEQSFRMEGANAALSVLVSLITLALVLPNYTITALGPLYSASQLCFAGVVSLVLYGAFIFSQTVRHRDYFISEGEEKAHARPSNRLVVASAAFLCIALVGVVALAKILTAVIAGGLTKINAPPSAVGVIVAMLVLAPEGMAAVRASAANHLQASVNLTLGSALASVGLTIPIVAVYALFSDKQIVLGLNAKDQIFLGLTVVISILTMSGGRTTLLEGVVHLVVFSAFVFFAIVP